MKNPTEFLIKKIAATGMTFDILAGRLGVNAHTFRSNVKRGKCPEDKLAQLATELKVTVDELKKAGVASPRPKKKDVRTENNIFPVIKAIAASGKTSITWNQFDRLVKLSAELHHPVTPTLVAEMLGCMETQ